MKLGSPSPRSNPLLICLVILSCLPLFIESQSDTIVVWSQESHRWTRLRGIYGDPRQWVPTLQVTFVGSLPSKDAQWTVVAHDPGTGFLFWVDARDGSSILSQFASDNLLQTTSPASAQKILSRRDFKITGLAVDWNTGSLYFAESNNHFIGVTSKTNDNLEDSFRVVASENVDRPIGVAVMPVWRAIYWINAGYKTIVRSELDGSNRRSISSVTEQDVGEPLCMTLDHDSQVLYWASRQGDRVVIKKLQLGKLDPIAETLFALSGGINSIASFQNYIYTLNSTQYKLDIYVNDKSTRDPTREYIIDAQANDITIVKPQKPTFSECTDLDCSHICMNVNNFDGNYESTCVCGHAYTKDVDGRSCYKVGTEGRTSFLYSHGKSVWLSDADISFLPKSSIDLNERPIQENFGDIRAVGGHVMQSLVFFADQANGVIYRSSSEGGNAQELTVNTRKVQGLSVDWLGDMLYWADEDLGTIMCSKLDGRYHRVVFDRSDDIGKPTNLAVDSAHGKLFYVSLNPRGNRLRATLTSGNKIAMVNLDGSDLETLIDGLENPRGLTVDPRESRLFWIEKDESSIMSVRLDGSGKREVYRSSSYEMFGVSIFQDIVAWTEEQSENVKFGMLTSGDRVKVNTDWKQVSGTFGVQNFDVYSQPDVSNLCGDDNGGCQQLCFLTSARLKPSTDRRKRCGCAIGFNLAEDGVSCTSEQLGANFLMFVDPYHKQVYQITGAGDVTIREPHGIPLPFMEFPDVVDVNKKNGEYVYLDTRVNEIRSAKMLGKKKKEEVKILWEIPDGYRIEKIAIDHKGKYLFYTDSLRGILGRMDMNGENHVDLVTGLREPKGLVYHPKELIFWTEAGQGGARISMMKSDGTEYQVLHENGLRKPIVLAVPEKDENLMFWADERTINRFNVTTKQVTKLYEVPNSYINSIAASTFGEDVYFSVWNEKGIFFLNDTVNFSPQAKIVTEAIFARISHMTFMSTLPAGALSFPVVPVAAGLAAGFLFFLLIGLFLLLFCIRKPRKEKQAAPAEDNYFDDPSDTIQYANMSDGVNGGSVGNGLSNGHTNGHAEPPANGVPVPPPVLASESTYANTPPEGIADIPDDGSGPPGVPVMIPVVSTNLRKAKKPKELPAPKKDPTFELGQNEKVATRIHRLANRLRNRLSTIRWSGGPLSADNAELPPEVPDAQPYTKTNEKKNYDYKPALHNLPRGFAPASHTVPRPVKDTWGKNKHNLAMKGEIPPGV